MKKSLYENLASTVNFNKEGYILRENTNSYNKQFST